MPLAQSAQTVASGSGMSPSNAFTRASAGVPLMRPAARAPTVWWPSGPQACAARGQTTTAVASKRRMAAPSGDQACDLARLKVQIDEICKTVEHGLQRPAHRPEQRLQHGRLLEETVGIDAQHAPGLPA